MHSSQVATWVTPARFAPYLDEADGDQGTGEPLKTTSVRREAVCEWAVEESNLQPWD
jgi:hypothetical protein